MRNNLGCTKEDVIRGVKDISYKRTTKYIKQTKRRRTNQNRKRIKSIPEDILNRGYKRPEFQL